MAYHYINVPQRVTILTIHALMCSFPYWLWGYPHDLLCPIKLQHMWCKQRLDERLCIGPWHLEIWPLGEEVWINCVKRPCGKELKHLCWKPKPLLTLWVRPSRRRQTLALLPTNCEHMSEPSFPPYGIETSRPCLNCHPTELWANKSCLGVVCCAAVIN